MANTFLIRVGSRSDVNGNSSVGRRVDSVIERRAGSSALYRIKLLHGPYIRSINSSTIASASRLSPSPRSCAAVDLGANHGFQSSCLDHVKVVAVSPAVL